jgi:hypothetical protein
VIDVALTFNNLSGNTAYLALLTYDSGCSPDPWRKSGWYAVANNGSIQLIGGDLRSVNRYLAWFADWWANGPAWSGTGNNWYDIPAIAAFDQCYDDNANCDVHWDFETLDINGNYGIIVTLEKPGGYTVTPVAPPSSGGSSGGDDGWGDDDDDDDDDDDGGGDEGDDG